MSCHNLEGSWHALGLTFCLVLGEAEKVRRYGRGYGLVAVSPSCLGRSCRAQNYLASSSVDMRGAAGDLGLFVRRQW